MRNKITTDDLINRLPKELADQVRKNVDSEVAKWGGQRENAGRRTKTGTVLKICYRVSEKEKEFLNYARSHNINYDELMQG